MGTDPVLSEKIWGCYGDRPDATGTDPIWAEQPRKIWGQTPFCRNKQIRVLTGVCLDGGHSPCWRALQRVSHIRFASNGHNSSFETMLHHRRGLPSFLVSSCLSGTDRLRGGRRRRVSSRPERFRAPDETDCQCPVRLLPQAATASPRETLGIDGSTDSPHEGTSSGGSPPPDSGTSGRDR